ncbi:GNAT family N-acetyltransferase [Acetobacterium wieringae]|uniref:Ribosomal-protein-serine acetyltransferase n=1 Tax=Acetobacterium wieringae TaxID=52694 RepID=A0A1F2PIC7_9FIRM|nr:GNAT family protein [Acetobacterium wieringae]OFV70815.1 ribosomal-protein-serine acetyltransferase [Acetobacterium wieringae]
MKTTLRKWKMTDAEPLSEMLNNPKILANLRDGLPYPYTIDDAKGYIKAMLDADQDQIFAYAVTDGNRIIGSIGVFRKENIHFRTAELGYYIAESDWGQGHGTRAVKQICELIFETTDIIRIFAEPFVRNLGSCRILEKAGFQVEGILRKNAVKNGQIEDMKLYALIRE